MSLITVYILLVCTIHIYTWFCHYFAIYWRLIRTCTIVRTGICGPSCHLSLILNTMCFCYWTVGISSKTKPGVCSLFLLLLLLLHQVLQLQCLKVLAFSITSLHLTWSWMLFVQLFVFIIHKSSFIPFFNLLFGLPANLVDIGFHSHKFLITILFVIRSAWPNQLNLRALM